MKLTLRIFFNPSGFKEIDIENPAFIPTDGEMFKCKWDDFIEDKEQLRLLEEFEESDCWIVERLCSTYTKDKAVCEIVLDAHHASRQQ